MKKYIIIFILCNIALSFVLGTILELLNISNSSLTVVTLMAAGFIAGSVFAKDHNRSPTPEEKSSFAWGSTITVFVLSLIVVAGVFLIWPEALASISDATASLSFWIIVTIIFVLLFVLFFWIIKWSFGWFAQKSLDAKRK